MDTEEETKAHFNLDELLLDKMNKKNKNKKKRSDDDEDKMQKDDFQVWKLQFFLANLEFF